MALLVGGLEASAFEASDVMGIRWSELVVTVHRQMRSIAGPSADLEDLTQTALEQVVRSIDRFRGEGELSSFTYRVCVHVALNHWRSFRRWLRRFTQDDDAEPPSLESDPAEMTVELERARRLHACLDRMAPERRIVVTLADLEDLPASRIAEIMGCPEPTVRSRLRRAREELEALLASDPVFARGLRGDPTDRTKDDRGGEP
jgi:RNA polymerase sigma-70 factor (ECF subfamily)